MSPVMACALLRLRGRLVARTARRRADLTDGAENGPSSPRQRVNVDQLDRRRRTVAGACGPDARKTLAAQFRFHAGWHAVIGIDLALLVSPQMMGDEFQEQGFGCREGEGLPVAASDQASR